VKPLLFAIFLCTSFLLAQDTQSSAPTGNSKDAKGQVTVEGCLTRAAGDYTLIKQNPAVTYELQAGRKIKFRPYLGQRVEVTGQESPSLSTSSDYLARTGPASPVTITVTSIRTIDKECPAR
jgi:hypothetical protein